MKVAITSQGPHMNAAVDSRFGRARYFIVVDTDTGEFSAHDNTQNANAVQGAGIQAGRNVVDLGVEAVITGNVGPKAFAALQAGGVKVYIGATGSVADAIEVFRAGELECAGKANVEGHAIEPDAPQKDGKEVTTMPRADGTGPQGKGPGTGKGQGPCGAGNKRGRGSGQGRGMRREQGRGRGRNR